ncbi:DUF4340 domain-containing protein [Ruminococcus sp.]|uniref:DUF4340 domain-containing protein n=1 Tax=Ruminococcus sp. TaxID=41978 RepID=UPI0025CBD0EE|nr:DUF4340 domain-containing protein [Ruminococcus sp.]MCR4638229.1 DUF4340 domain-containing protein [Ruminococcus sp.]
MKKPIIALIALVIAAGGSVGAFLAVKNKKDKEHQQAQEEIAENALLSFDGDAVTQLTFSKDGESYVCKRDGDLWALDSGEFAVDQTYCQLICTYTAALTAEENYGEITDEKLAMYGLDDPDTLEITEPKGTHTLRIGDQSPTGNYFYVTVDGRDSIYAVEALRGSVLKLDRLLIKNKELLPYTLYDLKQVTTYKDGEVLCDLTFDEESQTWSLPSEYSEVELDQTQVTAEFNNIVRLEAEEMMDEKLDDLTKYGFDKPYGEAVVKGLDGTERKLLMSVDENDPNYCYVLIDGEQVEKYYTQDMHFTQLTPYNYITQNYTAARNYSTKSFKLKYGNIDISAELDMDKNKCTVNGREVDLNTNENYVAFDNFFNSMSIYKYIGTDVKAEPELKNPDLTAEFVLTEGGTLKIELVKGEDKEYYVFRNGKYTGAYVDESMLKGRNSLSECYIKFQKLAGLE